MNLKKKNWDALIGLRWLKVIIIVVSNSHSGLGMNGAGMMWENWIEFTHVLFVLLSALIWGKHVQSSQNPKHLSI